MNLNQSIGLVVKIFFLLTPFFVLSIFIALTTELTQGARRMMALRTTVATMVIVLILYLFGESVFAYLGITLDAFRIGAGLVLLLSGIEVVRATSSGKPGATRQCDDDGDI